MINSLRGSVLAISLVAVAGGYAVVDSSTNYKPVKATVYLVDRMCKFNRKAEGRPGEIVTESCSSTDEFSTISGPNGKRKMDVDGHATVKVSYTAPQDGSYQTGDLHYTGRDDEFYAVKAGDEIEVLVSNEDPTKIRKS